MMIFKTLLIINVIISILIHKRISQKGKIRGEIYNKKFKF